MKKIRLAFEICDQNDDFEQVENGKVTIIKKPLVCSAEFTAWERGLRSQIADAEGPQVEWSRDDLPGIKRLLARLLETKAREAKRK